MFSNSQLEKTAKDELLNIYDQHEDLYYIENSSNHNEYHISKNYQQINQDKQFQNNLKILNNTLNVFQGQNADSENKNKKEISHQSINEYQNLKRLTNNSNSKTADNQRRKVLKNEMINTAIRSNESSLHKSTTRGSSKPDIKIYESFLNNQEQSNPYSDILTASKNNTLNQFSNSIQNNENNLNNENEEDETPIFLSQIYQKREKVVNEAKNSSKNRMRSQKIPQLSELQQNSQNIYQGKQIENLIQQQQLQQKQILNNISSDKKCFSVKNSKRQFIAEPLSSKKIEEGKVRRVSLHNIKKFNLDGSFISNQAQDQFIQSQNVYQNLVQSSENKEMQYIDLYIKGQSPSKENILKDQQRCINNDSLSKIDNFQNSRERWVDKLESDYFNLLSKNIKGQRGFQQEQQSANNKNTNQKENQSLMPPKILKESFLENQLNESQILQKLQENSKSPYKIQSSSIINISENQKIQSGDTSNYLKNNQPQVKQNLERKNSIPQRNSKKGTQTQSGKRRKSIQIFKKFDPNIFSIDMIKSQLKEEEIPDTVQKYFESKKQQILHQQQYILPQSQNMSPRDLAGVNSNTNRKQEKNKTIEISQQALFQNQEIINRINDQKQTLVEQQNAKNLQEISFQSQKISPLKDLKAQYRSPQSPYQEQINNVTQNQQQGSLFYNYIEYKQFKSKLEYEREMKKKEMIKKAKLRNKSPFQGVSYQLEEYQVQGEKQKEHSQNDAHEISNLSKKNQFITQNQQDIFSQYRVNKQKQKVSNINNNLLHLNDRYVVQQLRIPQSVNNNQNELKKFKPIQFGVDAKNQIQNHENTQNSLNNSLQQNSTNININSSNNNNLNKLPLILKKYMF